MQHNPDLIQDIFDQAAELPMSKREAYLDEKCDGDAVLKAKIQSWLAQLKEIPTVEGVAPSQQPGPYAPGDRLGQYTITRQLGAGGFGVVYLARQDNPSRDVAIKVILPEYSGRDSKFFKRFKAEQEALARLEHPYIATLYTCGQDDQARPYIVMQYIDGEHLDTACDSHQLDIGERLRIAAELCDAVSHAHSKGLIHRDLKPGNILLSLNSDDEKLHPTVIDFGIAKAIESPLSARELTQGGNPMGTYGYMSPEQADGDLKRIDTRTDVYALGVILYQLLAGRLPLEQAELDEYGDQAKKKMIREVDPPRPGSWLKTSSGKRGQQIARDRSTEIGDLSRKLSRELEHIPMRALRKEPEERYDSAKTMGDDIRRYLKGDRLVAGPDSAAYRLRKSIRRNKGAYSAVAAIILVLIAGVVVSLMFAFDAEASREVAEGQTSLAQENANIAAHEAKIANLRLYAARVNMAKIAWEGKHYSKFDRALSAAKESLRKINPEGGLPFEFKVLQGKRDGSISSHHLDPTPEITRASGPFEPKGTAIGFNGNGSLIATLEPNATAIHIRDAVSNELLMTLDGAQFEKQSYSDWPNRPRILFSQDGSTLVAVARLDGKNTVGKIRVWDLVAGGFPNSVIDRVVDSGAAVSAMSRRPFNQVGDAVALSNDGSLFAYSCNVVNPKNEYGAQTIRVIDVRNGDQIDEVSLSTNGYGVCSRMAFDSKGSRLAFTIDNPLGFGSASYLYIEDIKNERLSEAREIRSLDGDPRAKNPRSIAFHPRGTEIAIGIGAELWLFDSTTDASRDPKPHRVNGGSIREIAYSDDGSLLAVGTASGAVALYGKPIAVTHMGRHPITFGVDLDELYGHASPILELRFSEDSSRLYSLDGSIIKTWVTSKRAVRSGVRSRSPRGWLTFSQAYSQDGRFYAYTCNPRMGPISINDPDGLWLTRTDDVGGGFMLAKSHANSRFSRVAFSPQGKQIAAENNGYIRRWNFQTGEELDPFELPERGRVNSLSFSPDGQWLLVDQEEVGLVAYSLEQWPLDESNRRVLEGGKPRFSPDGLTMATACADGRLLIWSIQDWSQVLSFQAHDPVRQVAIREIDWSPNGELLATKGWDGFIRMWDALTGRQQWEFKIQGNELGYSSSGLCFTSDGRRLVSGRDHSQFIDVETGEFIIVIENEKTIGSSAHDGSLMFSLSNDRAYMPWRFEFLDTRPHGVIGLEREQGEELRRQHTSLINAWFDEQLDDAQVVLRLEEEVKGRSVEEESTLRSLVLEKLVDRRAAPAEHYPLPKRSSVPVVPPSDYRPRPTPTGPPTEIVDDE